MADQEKIEARMANGNPFEFHELQTIACANGGNWREADRAIQRWRRKGWISFLRMGNRVVWSLTDKGRIETAEMFHG